MRALHSLGIVLVVLLSISIADAQNKPKPQPVQQQASSQPQTISPEELVAILKAPKSDKPLILNVGPRSLYMQARIPGAEYIGAGSDPAGIQALRTRVKSLPKTKFIVIYCGCCPWSHCPNVQPAYAELRSLGFTKAKILYIPDNLGTDWVYKGYPTERGQ